MYLLPKQKRRVRFPLAALMENFWTIVSRWEPIGQGVFFLVVFGGLAALIRQLAFYAAVSLRGWPKQGEIEDEEDLE